MENRPQSDDDDADDGDDIDPMLQARCDAAEAHGVGSEDPDFETGDLQILFCAAWYALDAAGQTRFWANAQIVDLLQDNDEYYGAITPPPVRDNTAIDAIAARLHDRLVSQEGHPAASRTAVRLLVALGHAEDLRDHLA